MKASKLILTAALFAASLSANAGDGINIKSADGMSNYIYPATVDFEYAEDGIDVFAVIQLSTARNRVVTHKITVHGCLDRAGMIQQSGTFDYGYGTGEIWVDGGATVLDAMAVKACNLGVAKFKAYLKKYSPPTGQGGVQ
jgi:hypothetical protein